MQSDDAQGSARDMKAWRQTPASRQRHLHRQLWLHFGVPLRGAAIGVTALFMVESFELTNGFGIMTDVYDPFDYLANALGVALAYFVDVVSARVIPVDRSST